MRSEVITAYTIDGAVERILEELKEDIGGTSSGRRHNVIYFDGWDGLGASAVLREVGRRLAPAASEEKKPALGSGLEFSLIINLDCSKWESRRAMQRSLAEQLKLPPLLMKMFIDAQDEEDDYKGVGKGFRTEIPQVADAIYRHIQKQPSSRFLVIFNNGSCEEIDLESFGFPLSGYSRNKVLWSFQGGFRFYPRLKVDSALESMKTTDVVLSAASDPDPAVSGFNLSDILRQEAAEVAGKINDNVAAGINWTTAAADCFLYMLQHGTTDDDRVWLSYDALQQEMRLDVGYYQSQSLPPPVRRLPEQIPYWTSPKYGFILIRDQSGHIPKGMFLQYDKLCVLKLSGCTFSFTSPPFLCCHSLRFLWLDHCRDESSNTDGAGNQDDIRRCFQRLWVLDVRYSSSKFLSGKMMDFMAQLRELHVMGQEFDMVDVLQGRLQNIRKLRVTKSHATASYYRDTVDLFSGKVKMELLDFSGNTGYTKSFPVVSSCNSLETIIINGSKNLEEISLNGCATLKNLYLSGLFQQLYSLDITGTAVKTLDLSAVTAPKLDSLFLLDCGKLCAILWPPKDNRKRYLGKLRMDTTQKEGSDSTVAATTATSTSAGGSPVEFDWYISARDARILGSLAPIKDYFGPNDAHVVISTTPSPSPCLRGDATSGNKGDRMKSSSRQQEQGTLHPHKDNSSIYADVATTFKKDTIMDLQANGGDCDDWANMCICPPPPTRTRRGQSFPLTQRSVDKETSQDCYICIEDEMMTTTLNAGNRINVPGFICDGAKILHMQDSLSITSIFAAPLGSSWNKLEWCRVERCPKLGCVFSPQVILEGTGTSNHMDIFKKLKTMWASHLCNTRYILEHPSSEGPRYRAFANLTLLHLYCCPRLLYAVPLQHKTVCLENLETLEIMWCGDLNVVFHLYEETSDHGRWQVSWSLPNLRLIHLHELPRLRGIFNVPWDIMDAPKFETVRIRGCWSLKTLPPFIRTVKCDCEKEWWDRMEEGHRKMLAYHHKPAHPRYYKKTMLRGSPLR
ncbi:uncharacterized protein [Miscanthus floridulus]|uniref:uncharacterized protein n=1 Tax=Miscanthus floridulus TaxID=154761 RepID=UPI0034573EEF